MKGNKKHGYIDNFCNDERNALEVRKTRSADNFPT